jgi:Tfp pilus assembly protein PilV
MTLLELLIAGVVFVFGTMGIIILITTALASNNRNRMDTTSTLLAQAVMEQIATKPANAAGAAALVSMTDCNPSGTTTFTINTVGSTTGTGATLLSNGSIDFTEAITSVPANYGMQFVMCGTSGRQATYDVRWNVKQLSTTTKLVTVAARLKGGAGDARLFAIPVSLRTIVGM